MTEGGDCLRVFLCSRLGRRK